MEPSGQAQRAIEQLLNAEEAARGTVAEAREAAEKVTEEARDEADVLVERAKREAEKEAKELLETARRETVLSLGERRRSPSIGDVDALARSAARNMDSAVELLVDWVTGKDTIP
jgi:vacuolar-type H+-ATPase subunit H